MKILMVTSALGIGGAETHIITLARELAQRGHTVEIASGGGALTAGLSLRHITLPLHRKDPLSVFRCVRALKKLFREEKYDIIHAHARFPALLCRFCGAFPLITTAHWVFRTGFPYKFLTVWGDGTLAVSADIQSYLLRHYPKKIKRLRTTVNGIDLSRFFPKTERPSQDILHVSRFDPGRSLCAETLLALFPAFAKTHPEAKLILVGDGVLFPKLKKEAEEINRRLGEVRVILTGATDQPEKYLWSRPVFVGVSRAALEAMACGCTTILFGDEGTLSLFDPADPGTRILAEKSNFCCRNGKSASLGALHEALLFAFSLSGEERLRLGNANRQYVEERYSPSIMAADALAIYKSVKRTVFCGYYGKGNVGDELTLQALQKKHGGETVAISAAPKVGSGVKRGGLFRAISLFRPGTTFVLGGGTLLQNSTSNRSLFYYTTMFSLAKRMGCTCVLESAGIGELRGERARRAARKVLLSADRIALRTQRDAEIAANLCPERKDILTSHDAVLHFPLPTIPFTEEKYALVSLRPPQKGEKEFRAFLCRLFKVLAETGLSIYLIPMHPSEDLQFCQRITSEYKGDALRLLSASPQEFPAWVRFASLCIGMRFHLAILSLSCGVPCFYLPYDEKLVALEADLDHLFRGKNPALQRLSSESAEGLLAALQEDHRKEILDLAKRMKNR